MSIIHVCNTYIFITPSMSGPVLGTKDTGRDKTSDLLKPMFWLEEKTNIPTINRLIANLYSGCKGAEVISGLEDSQQGRAIIQLTL